MLWLYLLGAVIVLAIAVRRLWHRQKPLVDELYAKRIAIDHMSTGVAWVLPDGRLGSVNPSLAAMVGETQKDMPGRDWTEIFPAREHQAVQDAYRQMLLAGIASINALKFDGRGAVVARIVLVAVHDHRTRLMGHHCIVEQAAARDQPVREDARAAFANMAF